ncbi:excalibur calcium-binding domain-containing protein [Sphingobium yanoikuyae]|uniref:excalibur calcium-binding domain-containing protein n=1 Tax=Sphingobium yanoikuyae TaxID=13690 RepID=UPI0009B707FD|nr:excalibur calcium-binding domain-containing protein [Sphingobium yanoikuyae]WQE09617.1 excalibur calcium-binding domain-containing protein [Sphingobium yanoikuyae]
MSAAELDAQQPADRGSTSRPQPQTVATSTNTSTWSYRNCREARAAGAAPLHRGQPGYGAHMDGDGDGIACEPYRGRY